jgi:esterase/lipase
VLLLLAALLLLLVLLFFLPFNVDNTSVSNPANSHDDALARISAVQEAEKNSGEINPVCVSNVMTHGETTEKALILYHGFTSCPEQFRELGETFFEQGYNIYIPRLPHHGHSDQLSDALINTSAEELAAFATETVDIANGLGEEVIVGGLSGGGTISTWIAQEHEDVDTAVMVAPFLGIGFIPTVLNQPFTQIADNIPNIWMWWDPERKADNPFTQPYQYPRYPLHALAEYMRLGFAVQQDAKSNKPGVDSIVVITNANDESINNGIVAQIEALWLDHGEELIRTYEFEKDLGLPHDVITPTREDGNPAIVYPIIIDYITSAP